ncbi:DEAD/DEAH box helicase [Bacillus sp. FJAT-45350]|uniref:DEAD/DEAH box helicase n=1 Tax=Bacillus sp. FJAT-45350 TaxID=2011014 RepID=UPI000BB681E9|nr:DEAD/DEAH box helicase [Bacillus sp. FJAT-45350]
MESLKENRVILHGGFLNEETFFIWGERKKQKKYMEYVNFQYPFLYSPAELKLELFRYDEESFYGTFISTDKAMLDVPLLERHFYSPAGEMLIYQANSNDENHLFPIEGITIPIESLATYIELIKTWKSSSDWYVSGDLSGWIEFFEQIQIDISKGAFLPTTDGHWKLRRSDWSAWKKIIPQSGYSLKTQSAHFVKNNQELSLQVVANSICDKLIRDLLHSEQDVKDALINLNNTDDAILSSVVESLDSENTVTGEVDELYLLEELGVLPQSPFKTGIAINEPKTESEEWTLSLFIQDREDPSLFITMEQLKNGDHPWRSNPISKIKQDLSLGTEKVPKLVKLSPTNSEITVTADEVYMFLTEDFQRLQEIGFTIYVPQWMRNIQNQYSVQVNVAKQNEPIDTSIDPLMSWESLTNFQYHVSVGGATLTEEEFTSLVKRKESLVKVRGKWLLWDPKQANKLKQQLDSQKEEPFSFFDALQKHMAADSKPNDVENSVDEEFHIDWQVNWDDKLEKILSMIEQKDIPLVEPPLSLQGTLRPYQQEGYSWLLLMRKIGFGACLADDMGLGKSIQTISYLLKIREVQKQEKKSSVPFLLICPTSLIGNWVHELEQFAPKLRVFIHHGDSRVIENELEEKLTYDVIITSYALAVRDEDIWKSVTWDGLILDEAQQVKNVETKQRKSIKKMSATHRIALTGTPIENRLKELWAMVDFLNHNYLGSYRHFQQMFIKELEGEEKNEKRLTQLQQLISPFLLRRKKSDPTLELQLPDKNEQTHLVGLTIEQATLYQVVVNDLMTQIDNVTDMERRALILSSLTKLKQICNHPAQFLKDGGPLASRSEKWELLMGLLEQIIDNEQKTLIFTQYKEMGTLLKQGLGEWLGKDIPFLHGSLPRKKRDELINLFKESNDHPIFILSLKAGGTGLNLTAANHVIHYDRWWNPAVENQATDRAYRIGQKKHVTVHKMVTKGTLEERIDHMLQQKQQLADQVLGANEQQLSELSQDELRELLELRN